MVKWNRFNVGDRAIIHIVKGDGTLSKYNGRGCVIRGIGGGVLDGYCDYMIHIDDEMEFTPYIWDINLQPDLWCCLDNVKPNISFMRELLGD